MCGPGFPAGTYADQHKVPASGLMLILPVFRNQVSGRIKYPLIEITIRPGVDILIPNAGRQAPFLSEVEDVLRKNSIVGIRKV